MAGDVSRLQVLVLNIRADTASNRGPLSALVHPNCEDGDAVRDHTQRATWLGERVVLDVGTLRKFMEMSEAARKP